MIGPLACACNEVGGAEVAPAKNLAEQPPFARLRLLNRQRDLVHRGDGSKIVLWVGFLDDLLALTIDDLS